MNQDQIALELPHRTSLTGDDFIISASNREAVAMIDRWPDWPHNVLALVGPKSSGKTHLASLWREKSMAVMLDGPALSADKIGLLGGEALVLEQAEQVLDQNLLFHLLNWTREKNLSLLITANRPPARWDVSLADLSSRLKAVPVVELGQPDDALLTALLAKQFADRQLRVKGAVIDYLLTRMERSCSAASEVAAALDSASLEQSRPITVPLARKVLEQLSF